jgi:hypothetical protein
MPPGDALKGGVHSKFSEASLILSKFYRRKKTLLLLFWLQKSKEKNL